MRDEESPARVPFLDRLGGRFTSTFRPQEAFSTQMLDAAVRALNREQPQAVFVTGDIVDNAQENELDHGDRDAQRARPSTRTPAPRATTACRTPDSADPFYYRPDHDAPQHPGALDAGAAPVRGRGTARRRGTRCVGNHDVLAQGEVPPTPAIDDVRDRRPARLRARPAHPGRRSEEADAKQAVARVLSGDIPLPLAARPADPHRRLLTPAETESS